MITTRETHIAIVTDNNDDEKRGRLRVSCGSLLGLDDSGEPLELPDWIEPLFPYLSSSDNNQTDGGWFFVPSVGTFVQIELIAKTSNEFFEGQNSINAPDIRWRACVWPRGDSDGIPDEFLTNYPDRRGIKTQRGHFLLFDDTEGSELLSLECRNDNGTSFLSFDNNGSATILTSGGNAIIMDDDAENTTIISQHGHMFHMNSTSAYITTSGSNMILIDDSGNSINLLAQNSVVIQSTSVMINGGLTVSTTGTGATASEALFDNTLGATANGGFHALMSALMGEIVALGLAHAATITATPVPTPTATTLLALFNAGTFKSSNTKLE